MAGVAAAVNDIKKDVQTMGDNLRRDNENSSQGETTVLAIVNRQASLIAEILEWLCPSTVNPLDDQKMKSGQRAPDTAKWLLNHENYHRWLIEPKMALWLHGPSEMCICCC
jgi:hypothetical protein